MRSRLSRAQKLKILEFEVSESNSNTETRVDQIATPNSMDSNEESSDENSEEMLKNSSQETGSYKDCKNEEDSQDTESELESEEEEEREIDETGSTLEPEDQSDSEPEVIEFIDPMKAALAQGYKMK